MRIGVDIKAFKNGATGISRYLRSILDALQTIDRDNEYVLFSCADSPYPLRNPRWKKIVTPWTLPGVFWQVFILPRLLEREQIDVLWAPEQVCPPLGARRVAVVTTVHDLAFLRFPETCQVSNRWIQRLLFPASISRSAVVAPVSDYIGREVQRYYPSRANRVRMVTVANSGPGWSPPAGYSAEKRGSFLFFAGNLEPRKNLVRLVRALELLWEKYRLAVPLCLAGPAGWKNTSLFSLLEKSPVKENVSFLGYVSEEKLRELYCTCKAFVYPSLYEGFGLPVLEALSLDCPVLSSRGTVMQEIAGDAALYFDAESIESIAAAIAAVYDPSFDRTAALQSAAAVVGHYSWERSARALLDIFRSLGASAVRP